VIFIALFWYWRRRRRHAADGIGAGAVEDEAVVAATSGV
jgi:hypothetical protein